MSFLSIVWARWGEVWSRLSSSHARGGHFEIVDPVVWGRWGMCFLTAMLLLSSYGVEAKKPSSLAASLARLRIEVEGLSSRLEDRKESMREQLRTLSMQRRSAKLSVQKAQMELSMLAQKQRKQSEEIVQAGRSQEVFRPVVLDAIERFSVQMRAGLPFRVKERLEALSSIGKRLKARLVKPKEAASQLWQLMQGELRLARENGLYTQVIEVGGRSQLAEIARLGMMMMFFQTRDGHHGRAVRENGVWRYVVYRGEKEKKRVSLLFDALRKQIRTGFWRLPNALVGQKK